MSEDKIESYAQWGDDVLVWEHFGKKTDGVFLEAGANHPTSLSQTYLLEKRGWTGVLVEPVPECCEKLRAERAGSQVFQNALGSPEQSVESPAAFQSRVGFPSSTSALTDERGGGVRAIRCLRRS